MSVFYMFLKLGFEHIADLKGYDHILFIAILCAVYSIKEWKKVLTAITAFTLGHTITLALATLNIVKIPSEIIEFLIPVTIFITAVANFFNKTNSSYLQKYKYITTLFFGLIHGLGFSNYLRVLLMDREYIIKELLAFNIGVELGQIIIVLFILAISFIFTNYLNVKQKYWNIAISVIGVGLSLYMIIDRFPF